MNRKIALIFALPLALGLSTAMAQDSDQANENAEAGLAIANEATMRVMDDAEAGRPAAVTANIPLPPRDQEDIDAVENASDSAGDAGIAAVADAAENHAAEQAQDALSAAQDAIEQRGRGGAPENLPAPVDVPEVPDTPRP